jgi:hypothetical protein
VLRDHAPSRRCSTRPCCRRPDRGGRGASRASCSTCC